MIVCEEKPFRSHPHYYTMRCIVKTCCTTPRLYTTLISGALNETLELLSGRLKQHKEREAARQRDTARAIRALIIGKEVKEEGIGFSKKQDAQKCYNYGTDRLKSVSS